MVHPRDTREVIDKVVRPSDDQAGQACTFPAGSEIKVVNHYSYSNEKLNPRIDSIVQVKTPSGHTISAAGKAIQIDTHDYEKAKDYLSIGSNPSNTEMGAFNLGGAFGGTTDVAKVIEAMKRTGVSCTSGTQPSDFIASARSLAPSKVDISR